MCKGKIKEFEFIFFIDFEIFICIGTFVFYLNIIIFLKVFIQLKSHNLNLLEINFLLVCAVIAHLWTPPAVFGTQSY